MRWTKKKVFNVIKLGHSQLSAISENRVIIDSID